ncbi:unnamed protein product [Ophioblennius macclurei]
MAQWLHMSRILQVLPHDVVSSLYPSNTFPIEMRHYIAAWIESQRWEDFATDKLEQEGQAQNLLDQMVSMLQLVAEQNGNVVVKMKLLQISRNMARFQQQPLHFAVMVRDILRKEQALILEGRDTNTQDLDHLVLNVLNIQKIRKEMHQLQEDLNWEKQNYESLQGTFQQNGMDTGNAEVQRVQTRIQQLDFNVNTMAAQRYQLLKDCVECLERCQQRLIGRLKAWRWDQHKSAIGLPFDENLTPLQTWCEQLLGINGNLREELMLIAERISDLQERLEVLMQTLIESSLIVDKQPPQVIKTQSKFSTTVRYLLGEKMAPGKPVVLKAQIINEQQARNLVSVSSKDNVGELINNSAILEHNAATKSTCATFRNMSIKKIKRADRKGTESVTEEKFALLFFAEIAITGCDTPYLIQMISQPLVITVHGCQDNNAMATIIWDSAFSEPDRVPFVVPERVTWGRMCSTLNCKFTSEVQTQHNLDQFNQLFLAQKIFNKPDFTEDFTNMNVSWSQFNKEVLPGRTFTFWQWFEGVTELTKTYLRAYWSEGLIFGFIGKQHLHLILKDQPNGTFMLRFSDSEIGGITIAYVSATANGGQRIQNIQPFTKRDLGILSLGDRIRDIGDITYLYPNLPKHDVFKKYYSEPPPLLPGGYLGLTLVPKVEKTTAPPAANATPESSLGSFAMDASQSSNMTSPQPNFSVESPVAAPTPMPPLDGAGFPGSPFGQQFNSQRITEAILEDADSSPDFCENISPPNMDIDFDSILETLDP